MSIKHIARIMHDLLYRGVQRNEQDILGFNPAEEFYHIEVKLCAVNLIAFALGHKPPELDSFSLFERSDFVADKKLHKSLTALVDRMPTLTFQFIPLVLVQEDRVDTSFLLRVRKSSDSKECIYFDLTNRKYDHFEDFLTNNKLPSCTLWYPENGILHYDHSIPASPLLVIMSCQIKCTTNVWDGISIVGSTLSLVLALTPVGAAVTVPVMFTTSAVSSGRSFVNLLDSCKHENGTAVAGRVIALAFNLTTFASSGLTGACRIEKLRKLLPAHKLQRLVETEKFLSGTMRCSAMGSVIVSVIGKVGGWKTLSTTEWIELAAILCFAYRENFNQATALRLFGMMQRNGVCQFFKNLCPNVPLGILRTTLQGPAFDHFLPLVMDFLNKNVQFKVDDNFATISLFGYVLQFELLFKINWPQLNELLLFLQTSSSILSKSVAQTIPWTQTNVNDVVQFLQLVSKIPNLFCSLAEYITLGRGHRFTMVTVRSFLTAKHLNRIKLLRQLVSLDDEQTEKLNKLRESERISGGDLELFNWLGHYDSACYGIGLHELLAVADALTSMQTEQPKSIGFKNKRIIVSTLLGFNGADFLKVPVNLRTILLGDESFLRLAINANECLLPTANDVWMRTFTNDTAIQQLETIGLLGQLFERVGTSTTGLPTLASALEYALSIENTTVPQVYYSIVGAWKQLTVPLDKQTLQRRLVQLRTDVKSFGMVRVLSVPLDSDDVAKKDDGKIIALTRIALLADINDTDWAIPFGPLERAACWLELIPNLRNLNCRKRIVQTIKSLVTYGTGMVLTAADQYTQYRRIVDKRMVMFVTNKDKLLVEVVLPCAGCANFRISLYLCGNTITI